MYVHSNNERKSERARIVLGIKWGEARENIIFNVFYFVYSVLQNSSIDLCVLC